ncbi:MAG: hypothetical protein Q7W55_03500 [Pseudohongiella sp.]|nr:hypothetical protein [Pseudohongiella sp.]MDO9521158.1 hypothetical protein [Pseudohongiella sp.]MDP2127386.1 hypothetical protein [Pseudohongiella sp.]
MTKRIYLILMALAFAAISACTSTLQYNPQYEGRILPAPGAQLAGRAVIFTTEAEDNYIYTGNPTSFTGGGTKISIPLGLITKEISQNGFERIFSDGAVLARDLDAVSDYRVIVRPRISNFSYAYNQLKNIGLLITPQTQISLSIEVLDSSRRVIHVNTFSSGVKDGDSYMMSGNPADRINRLAHEVITELVNQATNEVYYLLQNQQL